MPPEIALVVDALPGIGGAEKVVMAALELFPSAPVYTLVYNAAAFTGTPLVSRQVLTAWIDRLPFKRTRYRSYLPLMPVAMRSFDLNHFDLILSFSYAVAHGVRLRPDQVHISYNFTPLRYAWRDVQPPAGLFPGPWLARLLLRAFRRWDLSAARRVDRFAAVSCATRNWIRCAYGREAQVIYPPVDVGRFSPAWPREDYYITVSRLVAHKRLDLIVEAFSHLKLPLLVVGEGPELPRLQRLAAPNVRLLGFQPDSVLVELLSRAKGFVCAAEEDFGIAMVEAQAAGCPVIAYGAGGALETVIEGETGLFFTRPSAGSLVDAVRRFERCSKYFCPQALQANARRFDRPRFHHELADLVARVWNHDRD